MPMSFARVAATFGSSWKNLAVAAQSATRDKCDMRLRPVRRGHEAHIRRLAVGRHHALPRHLHSFRRQAGAQGSPQPAAATAHPRPLMRRQWRGIAQRSLVRAAVVG